MTLKFEIMSKSCFFKITAFALIAFFFTGCQWGSKLFSLNKELNETKKEMVSTSGDLGEKSKQLTTAILDITTVAEDSRLLTKEEEVIQVLATEDQRIEGLPIERIQVDILLKLYNDDKKTFEKVVSEYRTANTELLLKTHDLENQIKSLNDQIKLESSKTWFDRFWVWVKGFGITGIIVMILLVIFFPPLAGRILAFAISMVPSLISFVGLVGKNVFDGVVVGIQGLKTKVSAMKDDEKLSKAEILKLISTEMAASIPNDADKIVIDHRKRVKKVK